MAEARVFLGVHEAQMVLRLEGSVCYPVAPAIERALVGFERGEGVETVLVDLRRAREIDSTILGLIARLGALSLKQHGRRAIIALAGDDMRLLLEAVGFGEVFELVAAPPLEPEGLAEVTLQQSSGGALGETMLAAHEALIDLSEANREEFSESVELLRRDLEARAGRKP